MKSYNIFPLSVYKDTIFIEENERKQLIERILKTKNHSIKKQSKESAWTGDINGEEYLFNQEGFANIKDKISLKLYEYLNFLGLNTDLINIYCQRSWATVTDKTENIKFHKHWQSNVSFAYYLSKPENSGDILFKNEDPQNAISNNIYEKDKIEKGLLKTINVQNSNEVTLSAEEGSIVIFPSKTLHATQPNKSNKTRISLSGDISITLKNSEGFEHIMPDIKNWIKL